MRGTEGVRAFHEITDTGPVLSMRATSVIYRGSSLTMKRDRGLVAVQDVSLEIGRGSSLGIVGESGCGKSSLARSIVGLAPLSSGEISIGERPGAGQGRSSGSKRVARSVQMVFQDPFSSLNPRQRVLDAVGEPLVIHKRSSRAERAERVVELLERVGLSEAHTNQYPHQLSGGQRQRVCIARALAVEPALLVCDEPTSALDVSIQAQVVEVLQHLERDEDLTYLFITHDLALLPQLTEFVAVMYLGRIVESGPVREVLVSPGHPYTRSLIAAAPILGRKRTAATRARVIEGDATIDDGDEAGCPFRSRCWLHRQLDSTSAARCVNEDPGQVAALTDSSRSAACHFSDLAGAADVDLSGRATPPSIHRSGS